MTIVEQVGRDADIEGFRRDTITLGWDGRRQGHGRRRSDNGLDFAISLPNGTVLKGGDCLVLDNERVVVVVREAHEAVYVVRPRTPQEWAYYAYQVGNRHQPVMIGEHELIFPQNPAVRSLLDRLRVAYSPESRPFNAAAATTGHTH